MAEAPSLGDFFAKKNKKKIKGSNLNVVSAASKPESKKTKSKDAEAEGWQEEEVVAATMKVEVAGKLTREEDKKEEEDTAAPAWGKAKAQTAEGLSDRKYPTLAKSVKVTSNINIDDGAEPKVNISTSKNVFAALENDQDDEEQEVKRPKEIKPAMVQKKKGEREKVAIQREVDKYSTKRGGGKREEEDEDEDEDEAEEDAAVEDAAERVDDRKPEVRKDKKKADKKESADKEEGADEREVEADLKIVADLAAAKAKYQNRKKPFPPKPLPRSELEEEKENKPVPAAGKKKKGRIAEEEDLGKPKLKYLDE